MTIETDADRLAMLEDWDTLTAPGGDITCVFDDAYVDVLEVASHSPAAHCLSSDVTAKSVATGVTVTVNSVNYTVRNIQPDGTGMSVLILEEQ